MIKVTFSPEDIKNLEYERYHHPHPMVQKRMEALYLKSQKLKHREICRLCHTTEKSLSTWIKLFRDQGIDGLKQLNFQGQPSELNHHRASLEAYFRENPPRSTAEAQATIEQLTGIHRSPTQIREYLKKLGLKLRKTGHIPGKALDPDKQQEQDHFEKEQLQPRLQEAKAGKRTLFL